jgi:hypothetical protein
MSTFAIGDAVEHRHHKDFPGVGVVGRAEAHGGCSIYVEWPDGCCWHSASVLKPASFPIAAAHDPWRESEPNETNYSRMCAKIGPALVDDPTQNWTCTRAKSHSGHHLSRRSSSGTVNARWPQSAISLDDQIKPAEKTGPVVGMAVVRTDVNPGCWARITVGARGRVDSVLGSNECLASFQETKNARVHIQPTEWNVYFVPAAEWDAQQLEHERAKAMSGDITGPVGERTVEAIRNGITPIPAALTGDYWGPPPRYQLSDIFTAKLAIALLEADNASTVARVADEGQGGIGTAEARARLVWRTTECQREAYLAEAAALLKRVGELS